MLKISKVYLNLRVCRKTINRQAALSFKIVNRRTMKFFTHIQFYDMKSLYLMPLCNDKNYLIDNLKFYLCDDLNNVII